jgi:Ca2+-binding RTX toxin-like protein
MKFRKLVRFLLIGLAALAVTNLVTAIADANTVPSLRMGDQSSPVTANDIKPPECAALNLSNIVSGSGIITGTPGNDLIVGGPGTDVIDGLGGNDCILSRGGDDTLDGNTGTDVCVGGAGNATFLNCETTFP